MQLQTSKSNISKAKRNGRRKVEDYKPDPTPSLGVIDPTMRLAAAVVASALGDLRGADLIRGLDALAWLFDDGLIYLYALGYQLDSLDLLSVITEGKINAAPKSPHAPSRYFTSYTVGNDS